MVHQTSFFSLYFWFMPILGVLICCMMCSVFCFTHSVSDTISSPFRLSPSVAESLEWGPQTILSTAQMQYTTSHHSPLLFPPFSTLLSWIYLYWAYLAFQMMAYSVIFYTSSLFRTNSSNYGLDYTFRSACILIVFRSLQGSSTWHLCHPDGVTRVILAWRYFDSSIWLPGIYMSFWSQPIIFRDPCTLVIHFTSNTPRVDCCSPLFNCSACLVVCGCQDVSVRCLIPSCLLTDFMNLPTNVCPLFVRTYVSILHGAVEWSRNRFITCGAVVCDTGVALATLK